jgi:hypothetical protein
MAQPSKNPAITAPTAVVALVRGDNYRIDAKAFSLAHHFSTNKVRRLYLPPKGGVRGECQIVKITDLIPVYLSPKGRGEHSIQARPF